MDGKNENSKRKTKEYWKESKEIKGKKLGEKLKKIK